MRPSSVVGLFWERAQLRAVSGLTPSEAGGMSSSVLKEELGYGRQHPATRGNY